MGIDRFELRKRNHDQAEAKCPSSRLRHDLRLRRLSRRCSSTRSSSPTSRASTSASARARSAASCAGSASAAISKSPRRPTRKWAASASNDDGTRDHHHRHARLRPGPRLAVRAGADRQARRSVRPHQAAARRQRPAGHRRRHRRLALGDARAAPPSSRPPTRSSSRASRSPRTCWKRPPATSNSRPAASPSPAPTARSASWSWRDKLRGGIKLPDGAPPSLDVNARHRGRCRRPSRTACMSPKSRSIRDTGVSRRS